MKYQPRDTPKTDLLKVRVAPALKAALKAEAAAKDWTLGRLIISRLTASLMRRECAWCGLVMREGAPGAETTHGICQECVHMERAKL
jgi:hypothetical protein